MWEDRYQSVQVEDDETAMRTIAAYIDINPVRAKIVEDPKDYRWSGYGEAVSGGEAARAGLTHLVKLLKPGTMRPLSPWNAKQRASPAHEFWPDCR